MVYVPKAWQNTSAGGTPLSAAAIIDLETRVTDYADFSQLPDAGEAVRYCSENGSDGYLGLNTVRPMRTLQAAYDDLPSEGGTIHVAPGRYDVGGGLALTRGKRLWMRGSVKPPGHIASTTLAPLTLNCAIIYTSTGAQSLVTTIGGSAGTVVYGSCFENLIFEFALPTTKIGIDATAVSFLEVHNCYGFADFTSGPPGPAATDAQLVWSRGDTAYGGGGSDPSWGRFTNNKVNAMGLGTWGNPTGTKLSNNQQLISGNIGFGLSATATDLPMIRLYGGHRCVVRDNNCEFYDNFLLMDHCFGCVEDGDGGEQTLLWLDLYFCQGCTFRPVGISWSGQGSTTPTVAGAQLVHGDVGTQNNIFILPTTSYAADLHRLYRPTDDLTQPAVAFVNLDNMIVSPRYTTDLMRRGAVLTSTPGAVSTLNIPHGLTNAFTSAETTPLNFDVQPANANARGAPLFYVTADATNLTLNFASNLTAAMSYAWRWWASAR